MGLSYQRLAHQESTVISVGEMLTLRVNCICVALLGAAVTTLLGADGTSCWGTTLGSLWWRHSCSCWGVCSCDPLPSTPAGSSNFLALPVSRSLETLLMRKLLKVSEPQLILLLGKKRNEMIRKNLSMNSYLWMRREIQQACKKEEEGKVRK